MSSVSTYLNFHRNTEEAFNFYKEVFESDFSHGGIMRMSEAPPHEGYTLPEEDKNLVLHVTLPILGGHLLMGTDSPESMGFNLEMGNNIHINLEPDTRKETEKLYNRLKEGGKVTMELQDMFWGDYFGSCTDKYGVNWMFNCSEKKKD
jgi:PhnB protein